MVDGSFLNTSNNNGAAALIPVNPDFPSPLANTAIGIALIPTIINYTNNGNGNIRDKTDAGTYTYDGNRKNAVVAVTNDNGIISTNIQDVEYNNFNSPWQIREGLHTLNLYYGPNEQRKKTVYTDGTITTNKYFLGNYEVIEDVASGDKTSIHYIAGGDGLTAIYTIDPNGLGEMHYVYTDHLGSILTLTDDAGVIELEQNFDAWGRERKASSWNYVNATLVGNHGGFEWLSRGYTGHEHLSTFALINMNGRVYDPIVGRMLSVDNFVQDPINTQSYNRYSYVLNNPLKYTDPSGEWLGIDDAVAFVIGGAVNLGINLWQGNIDNIGEGFAAFGAGGAAGTLALYGLLVELLLEERMLGLEALIILMT